MAQSPLRKKLIEVALPLEAINKASAREKSIRHGHPSTLHLWWARRPLAACRAVLFGQLVDDPSAWPDEFPTEEAQDAERQRLFGIIERLVKWENSTDEAVLTAARWEIARSVAWGLGEAPPPEGNGPAILDYLQEKAPPVYDPFCGGGSIPLEAQRLGLRAYGSDLNPVAVLISKALVEIPPKFAGHRPVNPEARSKLNGAGTWTGTGAQGLAEDVRFYGRWMRDEAEKRIGHLYPRVEVTDEAVRQQPALAKLKGEELTVIAWLWARTVVSPNPAARGAQVPLVSSFMLSTKEGRKAWVVPVTDPDAPHGYRFEVRSGRLGKTEEEKAKAGTIGRSTGGHCILTGTPMPFSYIREQGKSVGLGVRLMAIVAEGERGRVYLPPTPEHEKLAASAKPEWVPEGDLPDNPRDFKTPNYGMPRFADLFTPRQLVALTTFSDLAGEAREQALADARAAGLPPGPRLAENGTGAEAYADAMATYLGLSVDKALTRNCSLAIWEPGMGRLAGAFGRQAMPMQWAYAETNPFAGAGGDMAGVAVSVAEVVENLGIGFPGQVSQRHAANGNYPVAPVLLCSDPPYYDNVGYADLSDFFYVWARLMLKGIWPDLLKTLLVPKAEELVATPYRHGGKDEAEAHFQSGMKRAVANFRNASQDDLPIAIYYAFRQSEANDDGISSTGWATFLQSLTDAQLVVDGTLPMRTEATNALKKGMNALASSIVLVCRKRCADAPVTTRGAFLTALKRELPPALKLLQASNIAPVDLAQASIGPGMGIFTRYAKVLESDDAPMTVKTALQLINAALDDYLSEQEGEYDAETRYAITWFETHGLETGDYGEAETLAKARNVSVSGVRQSGLIESKAGKVRLLPRAEMPDDWDPNEDKTSTVWECTQHLIRVLEAEGETAAAAVLARLGPRAEPTRDLAYRLYQVCERKKWAEEARAYNGLVVAWPELQKLAAQRASAEEHAPAQAALI